jgi:hypothetical protein
VRRLAAGARPELLRRERLDHLAGVHRLAGLDENLRCRVEAAELLRLRRLGLLALSLLAGAVDRVDVGLNRGERFVGRLAALSSALAESGRR